MPDGARVVGRRGDVFTMQVDLPADEDGFLGRQCPQCSQVFRVDSDDYEAFPDDRELWCAYCGHHVEGSEFVTSQQRDRMMRAVDDFGEQLIGKMLDKVFRPLSRPGPRGALTIQVSYRSKPFFPQPLPGINEERLVRIRHCAGCGLRYAVFGEHRYCPSCGALSADIVASDALAAEIARLDVLAGLSAEAAAVAREQGVFSRIWVDTVENLVGLIESLASSVFRSAVADAEQRINGRGNVFQRLECTADLFSDAGYADLRVTLEPLIWQRLQETWAARHVFTHNDGLIDDRYLARVPGSPLHRGQRLVLSEQFCRQAITDADALRAAIAGLLA